MGEVSALRRPGVGRAVGVLAALLEHLPRRTPSLAVLTYHRVAPRHERPDLHPGLCVEPDAFAAQVDLLTSRAHPVSIDEVLDAHHGGAPLPERAVHVTIDDGYADIERHAWPVLRAASVPATLFVPTAHPDSERTFWWDRAHHALTTTTRDRIDAGGRCWPTDTPTARLASFATLRGTVASLPHDEATDLVDQIVVGAGSPATAPATSSWAGLRRMADEGLRLAPHSRTHPFLARIPADRLDDEVAGSWADLRGRVGDAARPVFAPPGGGYDTAVLAAVRRAGLELVMTTERGVNRGRPGWCLHRINVGTRTSRDVVRIQLSPEAHAARAGVAAVRTRASSVLTARGG